MTDKRLYSSLNTFVLITKALYITSKFFFFLDCTSKKPNSKYLNYLFKFVSISDTRNSFFLHSVTVDK